MRVSSSIKRQRLVGRFKDTQQSRMELAEMVGPSNEMRMTGRRLRNAVRRNMARHNKSYHMLTRISLEKVYSRNGKHIDWEVVNRDPAASHFEWGHRNSGMYAKANGGRFRDKSGRYVKPKWVQGSHVMRNALRQQKAGGRISG